MTSPRSITSVGSPVSISRSDPLAVAALELERQLVDAALAVVVDDPELRDLKDPAAELGQRLPLEVRDRDDRIADGALGDVVGDRAPFALQAGPDKPRIRWLVAEGEHLCRHDGSSVRPARRASTM